MYAPVTVPSMEYYTNEFLNEKPKIQDPELWELLAETKFEFGDCSTQASSIKNYIFSNTHEYSKVIAKRYIKQCMPYRSLFDRHDIQSQADFGLFQAIDSFQIGCGSSFKTHSFTRIRGSIIDGLRSLQDFPRIVSRIRRELKPLIQSLSHELGRLATIEEVAARYPHFMIADMHINEIVADILVRCNVYNQDSEACYESSDSSEITSKIELCFAKHRKAPDQPFDRMQRKETAHKVLAVLSEDATERSVIYCYFFLGFNSTKISEVLKLSQTWVSAKKESGLMKLRRAARKDQDLADEIRLLRTSS